MHDLNLFEANSVGRVMMKKIYVFPAFNFGNIDGDLYFRLTIKRK